ncbi:MAG: YidC/Oxa1 family membrane protein insertase [Clostridia bacterium]|nr:YidC/Oxa1 family membrane protein insertase [Clostridia bacterium]
MSSIFDIINIPLGYLFKGIYFLVNNYGFTIILFTLAIKLVLLPLNIKQQKSMKKMQGLQPKLAKIQEKYANDKEKQSQETMKLYQEMGVNPMGGCLPMLIQLPVLIGLYNMIRKPMQYIMMLGKDQILKISEIITGNAGDFATLNQIELATKLEASIDKLGGLVSKSDIINFDFFGFDLSVTPSFSYISQHIEYILIPLLAGGTTYLVSVLSTKMSGNTANSDAASSMKTMNTIFPFMTAWFAITLPAGLGLYWTISNLFQIAQMYLLNKMLKVDVSSMTDDEIHFRERKKKKKK